MSDFARLPVGFVLRIKYSKAEWSPKGNKLILQGPLQFYDEADPAGSQQTLEGITMLDKSEIKHEITNPIRLEKAWAGEKGTPPITIHHPPATNFECVTPTQSKGTGNGGGKRYNKWTPKQLEACYGHWEIKIGSKYTDERARAYAIDGMVEISSMACKPEDFSTQEVFEGIEEIPLDVPPEPPVTDEDIPF